MVNKLYIYYFAIIIIVTSILTVFPKWIVDDAYISYRYAENLVKHGEFTFNVGEDPVEGYTGILLPLGIASAFCIGMHPETMAHFIGLFSFLILLIVFHKLLFRVCSSQFYRLWFFLLFVSAPFLYTHVFSGLETITFVALLLASALQLHSILNSFSDSFLSHAALALSLLMLSLCRPEGVVYAVIVTCILACMAVLHLTSFRSFIRSFLFFLVLPGVIYFVWRWRYYGYLLPNTFYAKQASSLNRKSLYDLAYFCIHYLLLPTISLIVFLLLAPDKILKRFGKNYLKNADILMLGSLVLFSLVTIYQYLRSNLLMNFSYRFFVPLYPIALIILSWLLSPTLENNGVQTSTRLRQHKIILFGMCTIFLIQTALHVKWFFGKEIPLVRMHQISNSEMNCQAGLFLKFRVPAYEWLIVHIDAGAIPFYSGLRTIDFGTLNDEYLAHHKEASMEERVDYFFQKKPGAVVFTTYEWDRVNHGPEAKAIISDSRFKAYGLVRKFGNSIGLHYYEFVFLRKDLLKMGEEITLI